MKSLILAVTLALSLPSLADTIPEYDRSQWSHWRDLDKDCEETREEALKRDAMLIAWTNDKCTPVLGIWIDWYTDTTYFFGSDLDADHIIPLKYAHYAGGWKWTKEEKKAFANDLENVTMVSKSANRSKGAKGPSEWSPTLEKTKAIYAYKWAMLLIKYDLKPTPADKKFIKEYISKNQ